MGKHQLKTKEQKNKKPFFDAAIAKNELNEFEYNYDETWGKHRRTMLLSLTLSSQEYLEKFKTYKDIEILGEMAEFIADYEKHLKCHLELTSAAIARLAVIGKILYHQQIDPSSKKKCDHRQRIG